MKKTILLFLLTIFFIFSFPSAANDATQLKSSLVGIQNQIKKLEKTIYQSQRQEQELVKQLSQLEKEMGEQISTLRSLEKKMASSTHTLEDLQQKAQLINQNNQQQQALLAQLIQANFKNRHQKIKLLLTSHQQLNQARLNHYYHLFYQAQAQTMQALVNDLTHNQQAQQQIFNEQEQIKELTKKITNSQQQLQAKKAQRKKVLALLNAKRTGAQGELSQLQKQEQHLSQLFNTLQKKLPIMHPAQPFAKMKHQLMVPIPDAHWSVHSHQRTYIKAPAGTPVQAIFPGRVVFAQWLRGIGLLIILDHGNGYMTLYGNNQKLYKNLGDWVNKGEMIAQVGQSGGQAEPGLYFEIRKDGQKIDPLPWFK